jgi:hypothetical protein
MHFESRFLETTVKRGLFQAIASFGYEEIYYISRLSSRT